MDTTESNEVVSGIVESGDFVIPTDNEPTDVISSIIESTVTGYDENVPSAVENDEPPTNTESIPADECLVLTAITDESTATIDVQNAVETTEVTTSPVDFAEVPAEAVTQVESIEVSTEAATQIEFTQVPADVVTQVESTEVSAEGVTQVESTEVSAEAVTQVESTEVSAEVEFTEVPAEAVAQGESTEVLAEAVTQVEYTEVPVEAVTQVESTEVSAEVESTEVPAEAVAQVESTEVPAESVAQIESTGVIPSTIESIPMETFETTTDVIESSEVVSTTVKQSDEDMFSSANVECVEESVVSSEVVVENEVECGNTLTQSVITEEVVVQNPVVENITESVVGNEEQIISAVEPSLTTEQDVGDLISQMASGEASSIEVKASSLETDHMATGSILIPVEEKVMATTTESSDSRAYGELIEQSENIKSETPVQQDLQLEMVQPSVDDISNLFKQEEVTVTSVESQPNEQVITTETVSSESLNNAIDENLQERGSCAVTAASLRLPPMSMAPEALLNAETHIADSFAAIATLTGREMIEIPSDAMEVQEELPVVSSVDIVPSQSLDVGQSVMSMNTEPESTNLSDALAKMMEASTDNMLNVDNKVESGGGTSLVDSSSLMVSDTILEPNKSSTEDLPMQNQTKEFVNSYSNSSDPNTSKILHSNDVTAVTYAENEPVVSANIQSSSDATGERQYEAESEENQANKPAKKPSSFSLGVPGLSFSSQNVRVANDGTKLVQIHQSQITPSQLEALQANPNIKVVFRHIPSGKSFTKPPKNLFNTLGKTNRVKRKSEHSMDDSVYNFEDDFSSDYSMPPRPPREDPKYARYNPNVGQKKRRGPGRPRSVPDPGLNLPHSKSKHPCLPTQMLLHEALNKLNKPTATQNLKIHISQVNLEILEKMELCPDYNLSLTYKHEISAEEALKELAQEWAEKEDIEEPPAEKDTASVSNNEEEEEVPDVLMPPPPLSTSSTVQEDAVASKKRKLDDVVALKPEPKRRGRKTIAEEEKRFQESREKRDRREKEEAEIVASMLSEQTSRSGRKRKPTRFSLDIARLTKRYTAADDDFPFSPPAPVVETPKVAVKRKPEPSFDDVAAAPPAKRGRGRPRKAKLSAAEVEKMESDPSIIPQVFLSLADQQPAKEMMIKLGLIPKEPEPPVVPEAAVEPEKEPEVVVEEKEPVQEAAPVVEEPLPPPPVKETKKKNSKLSGPKSRKNQNKEQHASENSLDLVAHYFDTGATSDPEEPPTSKSPEKADNATTNSDKKDDDAEAATAEAEKADDVTKTDAAPVEVEDAAEESKKSPEDADIEVDKTLKTSGNNPSDILARKLDLMEKSASKDKDDKDPASIADFVEEEGDVDNKYRLRKLLQQCSIEEIISVAIPQALNSISIGDFFLYKSGQMSNEKVSYASLYKQLENLHTSVLKESQRYTTLLRRANKVGGDRRLDKVILMPVYNKQAADALQVNLSSIDAHIGYIQHQSTAQMIAANSFRLNCKMDPPVHRLDLPDLADKISAQEQIRKRTSGQRSSESDSSSGGGSMSTTSSLYGTTTKRWSQQAQRTTYSSTMRGSASNSSSGGYKSRNPYQSRKPSSGGYLGSGASTSATSQQSVTTQHQQMQQQQQSSLQANTIATTGVDGMTQQTVVGGAAQGVVTATGQQQQQLMMDDGSIVTADEGKQLVSIGDGQYFELPEGYTLIQTDEGYIIGQPGATFVQGEDGNVYMTSGEEATEMTATDQMLTTTTANEQVVGEANNAEQLLQHLNQT